MKFKSNKSGFTLIELLVAMALFLAVVTVAAGAFIQSLRTQRNLVALMAANDSASLTLEQIAREMRTGSGFNPIDDDSQIIITNKIAFTNANNSLVVYELGADEKSVKRNSQKITADNVNVKNLKFILQPCPSQTSLLESLNCPRRITISLSVIPQEYNVKNFSINLQTTVSARLFQPTPAE